MRMLKLLLLIACVPCLAVGGVSVADSRAGGRADLRFVPASSALLARCRATAKAVGYPVPCPTRVPVGLTSVGGRRGCPLEIIGPGRQCPNTSGCWCGWVVGSSTAGGQSLVLSASPRPLASFARVVNGPAWYPAARTRPLGRVLVNGSEMREVWVPARTNDASSFSDHLALIWTVGGHTYAIGFQNLHALDETLRLDRKIAAGIRLIGH
jgi:hypothetical protein